MKMPLISGLILLAGASTVHAIEPYVGVQFTRAESSCQGFREGVAPLGLRATCDSNDSGWRIYGGANLTEMFGVEVGYLDAGEGQASAFTPTGAQVLSLRAPLDAIDLVGTARFEFAKDWRVVGRLGAAHWDYQVRTSDPNFGADNSDTTLTYGAGLEYKWFTLGYDVINNVGEGNRLDPTAPDIKQDVDRWSLGLKHTF